MCRQIKAEGYTLTYFSEGEARDAVYCPLSPEEGEAVWELLPSPRPVLGAVGGLDWNRDLSPWPVPGAFGKGTDFAGKGGRLFNAAHRGADSPGRENDGFSSPGAGALAGYSLAGLFALWSLTQTNCFQLAASMSGSLWYDGFLQLLEREPLVCPPQKVYLSLGEKEKRTRNLVWLRWRMPPAPPPSCCQGRDCCRAGILAGRTFPRRPPAYCPENSENSGAPPCL